IRRFSPAAEKTFNLLMSDVGRPLSGVRHNLIAPEDYDAASALRPPERVAPYPVEDVVREVIDTMSVSELKVRDKDGRWYLLRARPYLTLDNKIDGAVLVVVDINDLKRSEEALRRALQFDEAVMTNMGEGLYTVDTEGLVLSMNP